ncbi:Peptidase M24 [Macleaya cordata]|uniref:FACT complex subunit n=1 Tax=Macleaya cordata TaxID=56857 RepID=A0A200QMD5_MACCD|nr:Peptidase M24 [Macleaya cordata]
MYVNDGKGNASRGGNGILINRDMFREHLKFFYTHWIEHKTDCWGSSDALVFATPAQDIDTNSFTLQRWLYGWTFPNTIIVFMGEQIHYLCSQKKAAMLESLIIDTKDAVGAETVMHKNDKKFDGSGIIDVILQSIHKCREHGSPIVVYIAGESPEVSELFYMKDETESIYVKKAALLTSRVMESFVVLKLKAVVGKEGKISHSSLMNDTIAVIEEPPKIGINLKSINVDKCYPPIFLSGGKFDIKPSASSNDEDLYYGSRGVIICAIGSDYNWYCSNVARTYLIDANTMQRKAYRVLLNAQMAEGPEFAPNLTKSAGSRIGVEFSESNLSLNANNGKLVNERIVFNVSLGFQDLQAQTNDPKTEKFSLKEFSDACSLKVEPIVTEACSSKPNLRTNNYNQDMLAGVGSKTGDGGERATLVSQEKLQLAGTKFGTIQLFDLCIRPAFERQGRRLAATLEADVNGFRYSTKLDQIIEIIYRNVKHAIFYESEKKNITLLHFHLHNHIMMGNKKTKEVQFYYEVRDVV